MKGECKLESGKLIRRKRLATESTLWIEPIEEVETWRSLENLDREQIDFSSDVSKSLLFSLRNAFKDRLLAARSARSIGRNKRRVLFGLWNGGSVSSIRSWNACRGESFLFKVQQRSCRALMLRSKFEGACMERLFVTAGECKERLFIFDE